MLSFSMEMAISNGIPKQGPKTKVGSFIVIESSRLTFHIKVDYEWAKYHQSHAEISKYPHFWDYQWLESSPIAVSIKEINIAKHIDSNWTISKGRYHTYFQLTDTQNQDIHQTIWIRILLSVLKTLFLSKEYRLNQYSMSKSCLM